jgi:hypothetical protein
VVAVDNTGLEGASAAHGFTVDTTPGSVQITGREGAILGADGKLAWGAAADPDPEDVLSYEIELDRSRAFGNPARVTSKVAGVALSAFPKGALEENQEHVVRVRAIDGNRITGEWSPLYAFLYNAVNEAPRLEGELAARLRCDR